MRGKAEAAESSLHRLPVCAPPVTSAAGVKTPMFLVTAEISNLKHTMSIPKEQN